jgi:hypothetical protein
MKTRILASHLACIPLAFACIASQADEVLSPEVVSGKVAIQNFRQDGATMRGEIVNRTGHRLEDVEVLITYNWLWRNEIAPGPYSPAWAAGMVVAEPLAPNEVREFAYDPPQPVTPRNDGTFYPTAEIVRFTEFSQQ